MNNRDRDATKSINGYNYQIELTVNQIINNLNDIEYFVPEGYEDLDIKYANIEGYYSYQVKYKNHSNGDEEKKIKEYFNADSGIYNVIKSNIENQQYIAKILYVTHNAELQILLGVFRSLDVPKYVIGQYFLLLHTKDNKGKISKLSIDDLRYRPHIITEIFNESEIIYPTSSVDMTNMNFWEEYLSKIEVIDNHKNIMDLYNDSISLNNYNILASFFQNYLDIGRAAPSGPYYQDIDDRLKGIIMILIYSKIYNIIKFHFENTHNVQKLSLKKYTKIK